MKIESRFVSHDRSNPFGYRNPDKYDIVVVDPVMRIQYINVRIGLDECLTYDQEVTRDYVENLLCDALIGEDRRGKELQKGISVEQI